MIRKLPLLAAFLSICPIALADAAPQCFRPAEIEAEQAVRYQAELMVLSDSCRTESYVHFTTRNRHVLVSYQHEMIEHFRRQGGGKAENVFDNYLTRLANEASLRNGKEPLASLCREAAPFLTAADHFGEEDFRHYVSERAAEKQRDYRRCKD